MVHRSNLNYGIRIILVLFRITVVISETSKSRHRVLTRKMMKLRTKEDLELQVQVDSTVAKKFSYIADSLRFTEVI